MITTETSKQSLLCVVGTLTETTEGGSSITHQIPTFFLNADVQGIVDLETAEKVACRIINPTSNPRFKVCVCVSTVLSL
jgi:hypothetical protein